MKNSSLLYLESKLAQLKGLNSKVKFSNFINLKMFERIKSQKLEKINNFFSKSLAIKIYLYNISLVSIYIHQLRQNNANIIIFIKLLAKIAVCFSNN